MEKSSFFNSVNGDRRYKAEEFASYFGSFISNGIFPNPATNLKVVSNNNMTVTLKAGKGWINGYYYENTDDKIFNVDVADGVLDRIDRVVLRLDYLNREIKTVIKKGTFASSPVAPNLQRDADRFELGLADIRINKGTISILETDITDTRLKLELCGVTNSLITVDVELITNQFSQDFAEWFDRIKGQLGTDAAGSLQNQINAMELSKVGIDVFDSQMADSKNELNSHKSDYMAHWNLIDAITTTSDSRQIELNLSATHKQFKIVISNLQGDSTTTRGGVGLLFNNSSTVAGLKIDNGNISSVTSIDLLAVLGLITDSIKGKFEVNLEYEEYGSYVDVRLGHRIDINSRLYSRCLARTLSTEKITKLALVSLHSPVVIKAGVTIEIWGR